MVELIESGKINSPEMRYLLSQYLEPMLKQNIDHLILGCTHYPYLIPNIEKIIGKDIRIIDSGYAVSKQMKNILQQHNLLNLQSKKGEHLFYTNTETAVLEELLKNSPNSLEIHKAIF